MKKIVLTGAIASLVIGGLMPFNLKRSIETGQASIIGKISPPEGAEIVWLISTPDSAKANVVLGSFSIQAKPGTYKLIVDAKSPYKDATVDNLKVVQNQVLDVGEIILEK
jgi:hypothetical protein